MRLLIVLSLFSLIGSLVIGCASVEKKCGYSESTAKQAVRNATRPEQLSKLAYQLDVCGDKNLQDKLFPWLIDEAKTGSVGAQFLLVNIYRQSSEPGKTIKWLRVLEDSGDPSAEMHLEDFYKEVIDDGQPRPARFYLERAKEFRADDLVYEDILKVASMRAKNDGDYLTEVEAYMRLGALNIYQRSNATNSDLGPYGFSLENALSYYKYALKVGREKSDAYAEAVALAAISVTYEYLGEIEQACSTTQDLTSLYNQRQKDISKGRNPAAVLRTLSDFKEKCRKQ